MAIRDFTKEVEKVLKRLQREQKGGFLPTGGIVSVEINAATISFIAAMTSLKGHYLINAWVSRSSKTFDSLSHIWQGG